jgi:hypothetical protein
MIVVICANIMKLLAMIAALWTLPQNTLAMVGDAAASFLSHPDPTTEGACLLSRDNIVKERKGSLVSDHQARSAILPNHNSLTIPSTTNVGTKPQV